MTRLCLRKTPLSFLITLTSFMAGTNLSFICWLKDNLLPKNKPRWFLMLLQVAGEWMKWSTGSVHFNALFENITPCACLFKSRLNCIFLLYVHSEMSRAFIWFLPFIWEFTMTNAIFINHYGRFTYFYHWQSCVVMTMRLIDINISNYFNYIIVIEFDRVCFCISNIELT